MCTIEKRVQSKLVDLSRPSHSRRRGGAATKGRRLLSHTSTLAQVADQRKELESLRGERATQETQAVKQLQREKTKVEVDSERHQRHTAEVEVCFVCVCVCVCVCLCGQRVPGGQDAAIAATAATATVAADFLLKPPRLRRRRSWQNFERSWRRPRPPLARRRRSWWRRRRSSRASRRWRRIWRPTKRAKRRRSVNRGRARASRADAGRRQPQ